MKDYNVTSAKEVGEPDQYGNKAFSVFFEGQEKPVFMKTKVGNEPTPGKIEFGVIEDAPKKSGQGTYRKFTRKQREEGGVQNEPTQSSNPATPATQGSNYNPNHDSMYRCNALNNAVATGEKDLDKLTQLADDFYAWLGGDAHKHPLVASAILSKATEVPPPEPQGEAGMDPDGEIDLDDIPF